MQLPIDDFDAIMFDLDGTLVDTMPLHYRAYSAAFRKRGYELGWATYMRLVGPPAREAIREFALAAGWECDSREVMEVHAEKKVLFEEELRARPPRLLPAAALLDSLAGRKPSALVSSGNRHGVTAILDALGWRHHFDAVITGDDVLNGKPDPEPYLRAAVALGVAPGACLALEDTPDGLASARAAGMTAYDVSLLA